MDINPAWTLLVPNALEARVEVRACRFEDCGEPHHRDGYCADHYHTCVTDNDGVDCYTPPNLKP